MTGNSFAAPHITGIVALLLSKHPGLRPYEVKSVLAALARNAKPTRSSARAGLTGMATAETISMAAWETRATPHFTVHFHPGGFAAAQVETIVRRLSRLREGPPGEDGPWRSLATSPPEPHPPSTWPTCPTRRPAAAPTPSASSAPRTRPPARSKGSCWSGSSAPRAASRAENAVPFLVDGLLPGHLCGRMSGRRRPRRDQRRARPAAAPRLAPPGGRGDRGPAVPRGRARRMPRCTGRSPRRS